MFQTLLLPEAFERSFQPLPPDPIWRWAEENVWLENKEAAESGPYRSAKTPWTRRLQEVARDPRMFVVDYSQGETGVWVPVPVSQFNVKKSSQSGFSEAVLNVIRWCANYRPRNTIYAIDTAEEAENIALRLKPSLQKMDPDIYSGNDKALGTKVMRLRAMEIWFYGSFSSGKFANKQAPLVVSDELEEHGKAKGDTNTARNLASRKKTADDGLQFNLSKPKRSSGPICKLFDRGNQEEFHVRCPACGEWQWFSFFPEEKEVPFSKDLIEVNCEGLSALLPVPLPLGQKRKVKTGRVVFDHCLNSLGQWDELQVLREAHHECGYCGLKITQEMKPELVASALWLPTAIGSPGVISQHMSDLYSSDRASSTGRIVIDFFEAKAEGRVGLQGFYNHRCGNERREKASKTEEGDIKKNIAGATEGDPVPTYVRGKCPFIPNALILGADVGLDYAKWALIATLENAEDCAVIDWGEELDPSAIAEIMLTHTWPCGPEGKPFKIKWGFMDAKYRKRACYKAAMTVRGSSGFRLFPTAGLGGTAARNLKLWSLGQIPNYPAGFCLLTYNDAEAKGELYTDCLNKQKSRIWFPTNVTEDQEFMAEMTAEEMILNEDNVYEWKEDPGPNHYGDCVKDAITGLRFLTRKNRKSDRSDHPDEKEAEERNAPTL